MRFLVRFCSHPKGVNLLNGGAKKEGMSNSLQQLRTSVDSSVELGGVFSARPIALILILSIPSADAGPLTNSPSMSICYRGRSRIRTVDNTPIRTAQIHQPR